MGSTTKADGEWISLETASGAVAVDPKVGNLRALTFQAGDRTLSPLHAAPWLDEPAQALPADLSPVERHLSGDFLCAPFGGTDDPDIPPHGWPANSTWSLTARSPGAASFVLDRPVFGATVRKTVRLSIDAPLLYQTHTFEGGTGETTFAHHPMVRLERGGRLFLSPKRLAISDESVLEPGRNRIAAGIQSSDLTALASADGGTVDLTRLPIGDRSEDFIALIEADGSGLGWTAIIREAEDDIVFVLKDPAVMPLTMLWHSNAGRDYAPWNGRHTGVIGIEDGRAAGAGGMNAARGDNPIRAAGVPTTIKLSEGVTHTIVHVIGSVPREGWTRVDAIAVSGDTLTLRGDGGARTLALDPDVFAGAA